MRDTTLTLSHDSGATAKASFTVLWVTVTSKHAGVVDDDNSARPNYVRVGIPQSANLGFRMYYSTNVTAFNSRGSEFIGVVEPADFVPSQFGGAMHLTRSIINGYLYWGPNGNENSQATPPGDDTSPPAYRDDDPQSGGRIYDVDSPGTDAFTQNIMFGFNSIFRKRTNFQEWAVYNNIRCSTKLSWYTRQSYKLTGIQAGGLVSAGTASTLTDDSKTWAPNMWSPGAVLINGGTGEGQVRSVSGNTPTTLSVSPNWTTTPDNSSTYRVLNTSTWVLANDVPGDNVSADGTTKNTWNLQ